MDILLGCECSGRVRDAFIKMGHNAISCDLQPSEIHGPHLQGDVFEAIGSRRWDAGIFFPDCTFLTGAAAWTFKNETRFPGRWIERNKAIAFVEKLWCCGIQKIAIENPIGFLSSMSCLGKPSQVIQPYNFNEDASKATCLWLRDFPRLNATGYFAPRITADGKKRWGNQTDSGQNRLTPGANRATDRARTYNGIAKAMAGQWG